MWVREFRLVLSQKHANVPLRECLFQFNLFVPHGRGIENIPALLCKLQKKTLFIIHFSETLIISNSGWQECFKHSFFSNGFPTSMTPIELCHSDLTLDA